MAAKKEAINRRFGAIEGQLQIFATKFGQNNSTSISTLESHDPATAPTTDSPHHHDSPRIIGGPFTSGIGVRIKTAYF